MHYNIILKNDIFLVIEFREGNEKNLRGGGGGKE